MYFILEDHEVSMFQWYNGLNVHCAPLLSTQISFQLPIYYPSQHETKWAIRDWVAKQFQRVENATAEIVSCKWGKNCRKRNFEAVGFKEERFKGSPTAVILCSTFNTKWIQLDLKTWKIYLFFQVGQNEYVNLIYSLKSSEYKVISSGLKYFVRLNSIESLARIWKGVVKQSILL